MKRILVSFFLLLLAGCSSSNTITVGLKVELMHITHRSDGTTQVAWRIVNPNVVPYLVAESTHRIYLNGTLAGTTVEKEAVAIPPQSNVERTTRLAVPGAEAERVLGDAAGAGSGSYRVESTIIISLYGDTMDKSKLVGTGTVHVAAK